MFILDGSLVHHSKTPSPGPKSPCHPLQDGRKLSILETSMTGNETMSSLLFSLPSRNPTYIIVGTSPPPTASNLSKILLPSRIRPLGGEDRACNVVASIPRELQRRRSNSAPSRDPIDNFQIDSKYKKGDERIYSRDVCTKCRYTLNLDFERANHLGTRP